MQGMQWIPGAPFGWALMVASVIVITSFTAPLTSQLTLKQLHGAVHGEADLRDVRVGAIAGTETTEYLSHQYVGIRLCRR
jgi:polar amino acid transport system substrate-binding protein